MNTTTILAFLPVLCHRVRFAEYVMPAPTAAVLILMLVCWTCSLHALEGDFTKPNPRIDYAAFLVQATAAQRVRDTHRLSEERFIEVSRTPGIVVLDARSKERYDQLHIQGAINIPFPDLSEETLARMLPDKSQVILIYCNNNFLNAPKAFASKRLDASLNVPTFITLHSYGYTNVFELGPLLDVNTTQITLVGKKE